MMRASKTRRFAGLSILVVALAAGSGCAETKGRKKGTEKKGDAKKVQVQVKDDANANDGKPQKKESAAKAGAPGAQ